MSESPRILVATEEGRRKIPAELPPFDVRSAANLLIVPGLLLSLAGWVDVGLFYYPAQFGNPEWEFGIISRTFDAMPLPTMGLVLLALGIRARGGSMVWSRGLAIIFGVVALLCLAALMLFALDIPLAFKAVERAIAQANQQGLVASSGLKRAMAKVVLFSICYSLAYGWLAFAMWRGRRGVSSPKLA